MVARFVNESPGHGVHAHGVQHLIDDHRKSERGQCARGDGADEPPGAGGGREVAQMLSHAGVSFKIPWRAEQVGEWIVPRPAAEGG